MGGRPTSLLGALEARRGIVCFVGAGGKKTMFYRLAALHPGSVGITSTASIPPFPNPISAYQIITEERLLPSLIKGAAQTHRLIAYAQPSAKKGCLAGVSPSLIKLIHYQAGFDITLVKADGTQHHWLKAPAEEEPIVPDGATTVIPMVSVQAIGQPLSKKTAYPIEQIEAIIRAKEGEILKPIHLARLLVSPQGSLKKVGAAKVVPLINMVDSPFWEREGMAVAEAALSLTNRFNRVVLTCMSQINPLVRTIYRHSGKEPL